MSCSRAARWLPWMVLLSLAGCSDPDATFELGGYRYDAARLEQWALPKALRELSGLTLDPEGRLFAHADEQARIYQLDYRQGRAVKHFDVGDPPLAGDFEGIAWAEGRLFLVTSDGMLLSVPEGEDGGHVDYQRYDTGLGARCEIEGLHYDPPGTLLMACKTPRQRELRGRVAVLAWSLAERQPDPDRDVLVGGAPAELNPSGLTRSRGSGELILVAARQRALLALGPDATALEVLVMPRAKRHPQMEGIEMTADGDLIIADEGGSRRGRLSVYPAER